MRVQSSPFTFVGLVNSIKDILRQAAGILPFTFTRNQLYDRLTKKIIQARLHNNSNCIDVGCHKGEIFDLFLKYAPAGHHFGFEPLPHLYRQLKEKYAGLDCTISPVAISDKKGVCNFNYVISNPAYSGLLKRKYDRAHERDTSIEVETDLLDHLIPPHLPIDLIKIDVEGGEWNVLKGATRILSQFHPLLVFECGLGGSDIYGTTPAGIFSFLQEYHYKLSLLDDYLKGRPAIDLAEFTRQFETGDNYYFIAHAEE